MDGDAYGIEIMSTYRFGSFAMAHENSFLSVPEVKWLGIQAEDIVEFRLQGTRYTKNELNRFEDLKKREYIRTNTKWYTQLDKMQQLGIKVEIQALQEYAPDFLLKIYLAYKLRHGSWC